MGGTLRSYSVMLVSHLIVLAFIVGDILLRRAHASWVRTRAPGTSWIEVAPLNVRSLAVGSSGSSPSVWAIAYRQQNWMNPLAECMSVSR